MSGYSHFSDHKLVLLVQATADSAAYSELVIRHQHALLAFMLKLTNNTGLSEDLCQDTLIKGYQKITKFKQESSFKTWLFSIGYREFLQSQRKSKSFNKLLELFKTHRKPEEEQSPELNIALEKELLKLGTKEREAILLCDLAGMSHSEAAQAMQAPLGSVKTYVQRARMQMNQSLGEDNE